MHSFSAVAYLLKARTAEPEKQPLLVNGSETSFVSRQQLQNRQQDNVVARQQVLNEQQLNSNRGTVFSVTSMLRHYYQNGLEQWVE
jgi:hypothetical protein